MLPREQRAQRVQELLARKNLTRHSAHTRIEISRPSVEKLWDGREVELEIVERFASRLGQDVNEWRRMWGYPAVDTLSNQIDAAYGRLMKQFGHEPAARAIIERHTVQLAEVQRSGLLTPERIAEAEELAEIQIQQLGKVPADLPQLGASDLALTGWEILWDGARLITELCPDRPVDVTRYFSSVRGLTPERAREELNRLRGERGLPELP